MYNNYVRTCICTGQLIQTGISVYMLVLIYIRILYVHVLYANMYIQTLILCIKVPLTLILEISYVCVPQLIRYPLFYHI